MRVREDPRLGQTAWLPVLLAVMWLAGLMWGQGLPEGRHALLGLLGLGLGTLVTVVALTRARGTLHRGLRDAAVLLVGAGVCGAAVAPVPRVAGELPAGLSSVELEVLETRRAADGGTRGLGRVVRGQRLSDGRALSPDALLRVVVAPAPTPIQRATLRAGTVVRALAQVGPAQTFRNPSPHPPWPARHALAGRAFIADARTIAVLRERGARASLERARMHVLARLEASLPPRAFAIGSALVLGEGDVLSDDDDQTIRDAGLAHVLAVSGLHVILIVGALVLLLQWVLLRVPYVAERFEARRIACALGAPLALVYAAFAGGAPSAWRAAVTAAIGFCVAASGRRPDAIGVAAIAVLLLGGVDPREALRPGFLLSVLATAAIMALPRPAEGARGAVLHALRIALATTLATAPLVLYCFGQLPLAGLVANVVLVPFGSCALLPLACVHAALAALDLPCALTAKLFVVSCDAFMSGSALFASAGPQAVVPPLDVAQAVVLAAGVFALAWPGRLRGRIAVGCASCALIAALELPLRAREQPRGVVRASFLDVGQGDAALIDLPDGRLMLIDAGGNPGGGIDPGAAVLVPLLRARRRSHVDVAVLTHPHPDHYGGLDAIARALPLRALWDTGQAQAERALEPASDEAARLIERLRERGTRVLWPNALCDRPLRAGEASVSVLAPCPAFDAGHDANDNSLVLRIEHGAHSMLFMGDAEAHEERALIERYGARLRSDLLKVGHHGSRTSTSAELLAVVRPRVAIISAGRGNRFGHPHDEVLGRLRASTPHVLSLAQAGGTIVTSDGKHLRVAPHDAPGFDL
jgi:competence protein ComEC